MLVPSRALNGQHLATAQCAKEAERKRKRILKEDMQGSVDRDFQAYGRPLETVTSFKYLGWVLQAGDE